MLTCPVAFTPATEALWPVGVLIRAPRSNTAYSPRAARGSSRPAPVLAVSPLDVAVGKQDVAALVPVILQRAGIGLAAVQVPGQGRLPLHLHQQRPVSPCPPDREELIAGMRRVLDKI